MKRVKELFRRRSGKKHGQGANLEQSTQVQEDQRRADGIQSGIEDTNPNAQNKTLSEDQAVAAPFPGGVFTLHEPSDAAIDIVFIHGLTGNRLSTWTAPGQSLPWPANLLPEKIPSARILTYGYDAYVVKKKVKEVASSNELRNHANDFLHDLTRHRSMTDSTSRPLIIVAHSLGGLVSKEAILSSRNNPESHLEDLFNSLIGIAFLGTPHRGSWMADWAGIPASALGIFKSSNRSLLEILRTDDQMLKSIQERFWSMVRGLREGNRRLEVTCFFEALPLLGLGKKVVDEASATLVGYSAMSIQANHSNMVKFASAEDNGFQRVVGELIRWKASADQVVREKQERQRQSMEEHAATKGEARKAMGAAIHNVNRGSGTQINNTGGGSQYFGRDQYFGAVPQSGRTTSQSS